MTLSKNVEAKKKLDKQETGHYIFENVFYFLICLKLIRKKILIPGNL